MYKEDLALNNLQWLICHKTQLNQFNKGIRRNVCVYARIYMLTCFFVHISPEKF